MKYILTVVFALLLQVERASAQNPVTVADTQPDTGSGADVHADPKPDDAVAKPVNKGIFVGRTRGFRVQIYNGADRKKAQQIKLDFMRAFPGIGSYISYHNPQFRVRIGDFKSRKEAAILYRQLNKKFVPSMIVPDVIYVGTSAKKSKYIKPKPKTNTDQTAKTKND
ncbi:MAG: SPOR domain-containing protein [Edaphocola sp.]